MGELVYGGSDPEPTTEQDTQDAAIPTERGLASEGELVDGGGAELEHVPTEQRTVVTAAIPAVPVSRSSRRPEGRLASEDVIINAPMSFAGAFQRTMRLRRIGGLNQKPWYVQVLWHWLILNSLLLIWWTTVAAWYLTFGLLLVPYRLLRRGARKRKAEALRHRELLDAMTERK